MGTKEDRRNLPALPLDWKRGIHLRQVHGRMAHGLPAKGLGRARHPGHSAHRHGPTDEVAMASAHR
jgi:hypothetical protein